MTSNMTSLEAAMSLELNKMNIYTRAVPERLREANSKVVRLLLPTGT